MKKVLLSCAICTPNYAVLLQIADFMDLSPPSRPTLCTEFVISVRRPTRSFYIIRLRGAYGIVYPRRVCLRRSTTRWRTRLSHRA